MEKIITLSLCFLVFSYVTSCPSFYTSRGKLLSETFDLCNFTVNGVETYNSSTIQQVRFYGLIEIACIDCSKSLISRFSECDNCMFCDHDEHIKPCSATVIPWLIGSGSVILILGVSWFIVKRCWPGVLKKETYERVWEKTRSAKERKSQEKWSKRAEKIESHMKSRNRHSEGSDNQVEANAIEEPTIHLYPQLDPVHLERPLPINQEVVQNPNPAWTGIHLFAVIFTSFLLTDALACDDTLFIHSRNQICRDENCDVIHSGFLNLRTNTKFCLTSENRSTLVLSLNRLSQKTIYQNVYHTSAYSLKSVSKTNCLGVGDCDYNGCKAVMDKHVDQKKISELYHIHKHSSYPQLKSYPNGSQCDTSSLLCYNCFRGVECTWHSWLVVPEGDTYTISEKKTSYWEAELELVESGLTRSVVLTPNKITLGEGPFKMIATQASFSAMERSKFIMTTPKNQVLQIHPSPPNSPVSGMVGDFQISLDRKSSAFPLHSIVCKSSGCHNLCYGPNSVLKARNYLKEDTNVLNYQSRDGVNIIIDDTVSGSLSLLLDFSYFDTQLIFTPNCEFVFEYAIGCTGCNDNPKVIFNSRNVRTIGAIQFVSNCSFDRNYLVCQESSQILIQLDGMRYCYLFFPKINQTINMKTDYLFLGQLESVGYVFSTSSDTSNTAMLKNLFQNASFQFSMYATFGLASILLIVTKIAILTMTYVSSRKTTNDVLKSEQM